MRALVTGLICAALSACAVHNPQLNAAEIKEANDPLLCVGQEQCALMWRKAQVWISVNSRWKIQISTDTIIETYSPSEAAVDRAYRITRMPGESATDRIVITSWCRNMFGCSTTLNADAISFKRYLRGLKTEP